MANQPNPTAVASRQGQFLGSTGIAFANQTASDIFFDEYWTTEGHIARMAVICTSWGISMLYFMTGYRNGLWIPANELLATVDVEDHGVLPPEGDELVAPDVLAVQAGAQAIHWINGEAVSGLQLPWHRQISVTRAGQADMHYHKPKKRTGHVAYVAPEPKPGGKHIIFNKLTFGTQVSNYRRVQRL
ncbi:hypothetical protein PYCCODRAFT_1474252 [Trametes coccinea BRFM310]|uniref:Uncharacterized protein n=1 Tax=Trametes coccinea (strain BRFM310) TaxID=1353009 RepID=A0A1Y2J0A2_TRAC3|nr:hypothetical protein PYCCODRAFT_1474252 [Trametes coccinea BRFM310]